MAQNNPAPVHRFAGTLELEPLAFPSDSTADLSGGGFNPTFLTLPAGGAVVADTDPQVLLITPTTAVLVTLPAPGSAMDGRVYTVYVGAAAGGQVTVRTGTTQVPGTAQTAATNKAAIIQVFYDAGAVSGVTIQSA